MLADINSMLVPCYQFLKHKGLSSKQNILVICCSAVMQINLFLAPLNMQQFCEICHPEVTIQCCP